MDPIQSIIRRATRLLILACLVGTWFGGFGFGFGVLFSGILMIGSLAGAAWLLRLDEAGHIPVGNVPLLLSVKSPIVLAAGLLLVISTNALAVAVGGSVLVIAITIDSAHRFSSATPSTTPTREA
ncbi:MAG: hypothetical protein AAFV53_01360 [Myxococcota bacterium]